MNELALVANAREALRGLAQPGNAARESLGKVLTDVIVLYLSAAHPVNTEEDCPECHDGKLHRLFLATHVPSCSGHPARRRAKAAHDAVLLLDRLPGMSAQKMGAVLRAAFAIPPALPSQPRRAIELDEQRARDALNILVTGKEGLGYGRTRADSLRLLGGLVSAVEHALDRTTDPCPHCGAVLGLDQFAAHLWTCDKHPSVKEAARYEALLDTYAGSGGEVLQALVEERNRLREGLQDLSDVTDWFDSEMGWDGECGYSEAWTERIWKQAWRYAGGLIGHHVPSRPSERKFPKAPGWAVLDRAVGAVKAGGHVAPADAKELKTWSEQLTRRLDVTGTTTRCPCCRRPGLKPGLELVQHLQRCHAAPLNSRLRRAAAELRFFTSDEEEPSPPAEPLAIEALRPEVNGPGSRWHVEAVEALLAERPSASEANLRDLTRLFEDFVGSAPHHAVTCRYCRVLPLPGGPNGHELRCEKNPDARELRRREQQLCLLRGPRPTVFADLQREADVAATGIARLLDACQTYFYRMGDGDRGKSLSNSALEQMLGEARIEVAVLLQDWPVTKVSQLEQASSGPM